MAGLFDPETGKTNQGVQAQNEISTDCDIDDRGKIARQNRPAVRPWFLSVALSNRPRCPGCGGRLLPKATFVALDVAWCESCGRRAATATEHRGRRIVRHTGHFCSTDTHRIVPFLLALRHLGATSEVTDAHGIVFWTPHHDLPDVDAYIRWLLLSGKMDAVTGSMTAPELVGTTVGLPDGDAWIDDACGRYDPSLPVVSDPERH